MLPMASQKDARLQLAILYNIIVQGCVIPIVTLLKTDPSFPAPFKKGDNWQLFLLIFMTLTRLKPKDGPHILNH